MCETNGRLPVPHPEKLAQQASRRMRSIAGPHGSRRGGIYHRAALRADPLALLTMRVHGLDFIVQSVMVPPP